MLLITAGVLLLGFGLISILGKDYIWRLQDYGSRGQSQRSPAWDRAQNIWGGLMVLTGIVLIILGL